MASNQNIQMTTSDRAQLLSKASVVNLSPELKAFNPGNNLAYLLYTPPSTTYLEFGNIILHT